MDNGGDGACTRGGGAGGGGGGARPSGSVVDCDHDTTCARRGGVLVGVAGFDPAFPGSPLFRVVDVDVARPLLAALAPQARPGDDALRVYVEGQPALRDALVGVGGEVVMQVLRLEGAVP